jgi:hypothetical protein
MKKLATSSRWRFGNVCEAGENWKSAFDGVTV